MRITKRVEFDAAHRLPSHAGRCRNLHGHRYVLEVCVAGPVCSRGMVLDFGELGELIESVAGRWDHACVLVYSDARLLEAVRAEGLKLVELAREPTTEVIARALFEEVAQELGPSPARTYHLDSLRLYESPTSWVEITRGDQIVSNAGRRDAV